MSRKKNLPPVKSNPLKKQELIQRGGEIIENRQLSKLSSYNLFIHTFRFISSKNWLAQLFTMFFGLFYIYSTMETGSLLSSTVTGLTIVVILSGLFATDELFKSFTSGMWQLEKTFKYDLRQHITMKLMIIGLIELLLIVVLSVFYQEVVNYPFWRIAIYLLVPLNIFCILTFGLLTILRTRFKTIILWVCGGIFVSFFLIMSLTYDIYQLSMQSWGMSLFVTFTTLLLLVYKLKDNDWGTD